MEVPGLEPGSTSYPCGSFEMSKPILTPALLLGFTVLYHVTILGTNLHLTYPFFTMLISLGKESFPCCSLSRPTIALDLLLK